MHNVKYYKRMLVTKLSCNVVHCSQKFDEEICADGNLEVHSTP